MKIKINALLGMQEPLSKLIGQDLEASVSYDLEELITNVNEKLTIYSKTRENLIKKYGEEEKETKNIVVKKDKIKEYNEELIKVLNKEVEIKNNKVKISSLTGAKLSIINIKQLKPILERG